MGTEYLHLVLLRHLPWLPWRDHVTSLERELDRLTQAGVRVVVVSFGNMEGARDWLATTGCSLSMYLDTDRKVYRELGLHRSIAKVWNMNTVHYYASQISSGRKLPAVVGEEDPLQMGGDFTLCCRDGSLVMCHPSSHPMDRPSLTHILHRVGESKD